VHLVSKSDETTHIVAMLEHSQLSCTVSLKAERGGKMWIAIQANRGEAYIQASFIGWNLVLEGFCAGEGGLVTSFGMFCFGKTLTFGRTTFSWLQGYRLTRRLGMLLSLSTKLITNHINVEAPTSNTLSWDECSMTHLETQSPTHLEWIPYIDKSGTRCKLVIDTTTLTM
jgi:hypothetical protein